MHEFEALLKNASLVGVLNLLRTLSPANQRCCGNTPNKFGTPALEKNRAHQSDRATRPSMERIGGLEPGAPLSNQLSLR